VVDLVPHTMPTVPVVPHTMPVVVSVFLYGCLCTSQGYLPHWITPYHASVSSTCVSVSVLSGPPGS